MFVKNWYKGLLADISKTTPTTLKQMTGEEISPNGFSCTWVSGLHTSTNSTNYDNKYPYLGRIVSSLNSNGGVILGTGNTPPTINDYCLSGDLITNTITYTAAIQNRRFTENGVSFTYLYTITNTSSTDFTVREIGLQACAYNASYRCLLERTVLDNPVTIPAGGIGQISYTITANLPTA